MLVESTFLESDRIASAIFKRSLLSFYPKYSPANRSSLLDCSVALFHHSLASYDSVYSMHTIDSTLMIGFK